MVGYSTMQFVALLRRAARRCVAFPFTELATFSASAFVYIICRRVDYSAALVFSFSLHLLAFDMC